MGGSGTGFFQAGDPYFSRFPPHLWAPPPFVVGVVGVGTLNPPFGWVPPGLQKKPGVGARGKPRGPVPPHPKGLLPHHPPHVDQHRCDAPPEFPAANQSLENNVRFLNDPKGGDGGMFSSLRPLGFQRDRLHMGGRLDCLIEPALPLKLRTPSRIQGGGL